MVILILILVGFLIYALFTNPEFGKRQLAFATLATILSFSVIPCSVTGILAEIPSDGDALGGGFLMLFALFAALIIWLVLIVLIMKIRPLKVFCYGVPIIMTACFVFNCFCIGFNTKILLILLSISAYFILCAFLIEKAKSLPIKIISVAFTIAPILALLVKLVF